MLYFSLEQLRSTCRERLHLQACGDLSFYGTVLYCTLACLSARRSYEVHYPLKKLSRPLHQKRMLQDKCPHLLKSAIGLLSTCGSRPLMPVNHFSCGRSLSEKYYSFRCPRSLTPQAVMSCDLCALACRQLNGCRCARLRSIHTLPWINREVMIDYVI